MDELPTTERRNPASLRLDEMPVEAVLRLMNDEDRRVPEAVAEVLPQIAAAVELLVEGWRDGGRWIYVGAGTSGRIAALDAAECPPTFGVPPERVIALIAGGEAALTRAAEGAEDDRSAAVRDLENLELDPGDVVVGLAASGRTPYVVDAVRHASGIGCPTVGISNSPHSELGAAARVGIEVITGPEVLTGSTRLKAGTSEKLVLNMLSTAAFCRLGKVYENLMVDLRATNEKLKRRSHRIVREAVGVSEAEARRILHAADGSVKVAVVMGKAKVPAGEARELLASVQGDVRRALDATPSTWTGITAHAIVGNVLAPEPLGRAAIIIEGGKISDVVRSPRPAELPRARREFSGYICPGFIDLQINGAFGIDVRPDPEALRALARELPKTGTTAFLPTLVSSAPERYAAFLEACQEIPGSSGARMLGAHMEGPFLSPARKGAHDAANLRPVDLGLAEEFVRSGAVLMVTLAPELPRALEAIRLFLEGGIIPSAGHTDAGYDEMLRAMDSGLRMGTHLYNAMSPFAHRAPGAVGALLADDRARAGIIFDGVHVNEGALRVAYRQKGPERLALVTDAMEAAGMRPGEYELSGRSVRLEGGAVRLPDGTLAGSILTMDVAVQNAAEILRIPLQDAVRMATQTPAEILGMPGKGRIIPGADADLVLLGSEGRVEETIIGGESAYRREKNL